MGGSFTRPGGGVNVNPPGFSELFNTWKVVIIGDRSGGEQYALEAGHYSVGTWNLEKNPPCNAEDKLARWTYRH